MIIDGVYPKRDWTDAVYTLEIHQDDDAYRVILIMEEGLVTDEQLGWYEEVRRIRMYPLDFLEFAVNCGISEKDIAVLRECLKGEVPVPSNLHEKMMELTRLFIIVGGYPEAAEIWLHWKDLDLVKAKQMEIIADLTLDRNKSSTTFFHS